MFGIGFSELFVVAVIALLVVGPEKLPETIRTVTLHLSKIKRYWQVAKREIEQEIGMDDIRREIHNSEVMEQLKRAETTLQQPIDLGLENPTSQEAPTQLGQPDTIATANTPEETSVASAK